MSKYIFSFILFLATQALANETVTLQLKWKHQFQFAGYYVALEKGYYKNSGLDVKINEASTETNVTKSVLSHEATFGIGTSELVLSRAQKLPVVVLAVIFQHSPLALVVSNKNSINTIQDLADKKIMIEQGSAELYAYLKRENIRLSSANTLPHSFKAEDLMSGKVSAMSVYSTDEPFFLNAKKYPYYIHTPREGGIDFYGDNLFTNEDIIKENPEKVRNFIQASMKGWDYAMKHKEEIADLILLKYNTQHKTKEQLLFEAKEMEKLMRPDIVQIGYMYYGRWQHIIDVYKELELVKDDINLNDFIFNDDYRMYDTYKFLTIVLFAALFISIVVAIKHYIHMRDIRQMAKKIEVSNANLEEYVQDNQKNIELGNMVANISHQWREPLSKISYINLKNLIKINNNIKPDYNDCKKDFEDIDKTLSFMSDTMQAFLEFYKPSKNETTFNVYSSINKITTILNTKIKEQKININFIGDFDVSISGIENEWMHIWLNILSNDINIFSQRMINNPQIDIIISLSSISFCDNAGGCDTEKILSKENFGLGFKMCKEIASKYKKDITLNNTDEGLCVRINI